MFPEGCLPVNPNTPEHIAEVLNYLYADLDDSTSNFRRLNIVCSDALINGIIQEWSGPEICAKKRYIGDMGQIDLLQVLKSWNLENWPTTYIRNWSIFSELDKLAWNGKEG